MMPIRFLNYTVYIYLTDPFCLEQLKSEEREKDAGAKEPVTFSVAGRLWCCMSAVSVCQCDFSPLFFHFIETLRQLPQRHTPDSMPEEIWKKAGERSKHLYPSGFLHI